MKLGKLSLLTGWNIGMLKEVSFFLSIQVVRSLSPFFPQDSQVKIPIGIVVKKSLWN
jgi:hypothetical protein